jgi:hypothetical protein
VNGSFLISSGVAVPGLADATSFINCVQFRITETGLLPRHGSEVRPTGQWLRLHLVCPPEAGRIPPRRGAGALRSGNITAGMRVPGMGADDDG